MTQDQEQPPKITRKQQSLLPPFQPDQADQLHHSNNNDRRIEPRTSPPSETNTTGNQNRSYREIGLSEHRQHNGADMALRTQTSISFDLDKELTTALVEENGRERLKRHRGEVAGRVWIPDIWGQEELLKDWIDCSEFDASLAPKGIKSARAALVEEGRRANSGGIRIENRC